VSSCVGLVISINIYVCICIYVCMLFCDISMMWSQGCCCWSSWNWNIWFSTTFYTFLREKKKHLTTNFPLPPRSSQIDKPNTLTIQYIVLFSHLTVQLPSVVLSQKHELAVWRPAPFFCIMTHVTIYLNGLDNLVSWLRHCSTTFEVHWFTLFCW